MAVVRLRPRRRRAAVVRPTVMPVRISELAAITVTGILPKPAVVMPEKPAQKPLRAVRGSRAKRLARVRVMLTVLRPVSPRGTPPVALPLNVRRMIPMSSVHLRAIIPPTAAEKRIIAISILRNGKQGRPLILPVRQKRRLVALPLTNLQVRPREVPVHVRPLPPRMGITITTVVQMHQAFIAGRQNVPLAHLPAVAGADRTRPANIVHIPTRAVADVIVRAWAAVESSRYMKTRRTRWTA